MTPALKPSWLDDVADERAAAERFERLVEPALLGRALEERVALEQRRRIAGQRARPAR